MNSLRYKDMIQDLVLVGRDPGRFEAKYATLLTAAERQELRDGLAQIRAALVETGTLGGIELVLGREEAVVGRVQDLTLQVGNDFIQRYYSNVLEHRENAGHRFGEGAERPRQGGAHRLPGDALRRRDADRSSASPPGSSCSSSSALAALWGIRLAGYGYCSRSRRTRPSRCARTSPSRR